MWLELVLAAQELTCWLQAPLLTSELANAEPKRLRTRLLHTGGRLVTHARGLTLRLPAAWPWGARPDLTGRPLPQLRLGAADEDDDLGFVRVTVVTLTEPSPGASARNLRTLVKHEPPKRLL